MTAQFPFYQFSQFIKTSKMDGQIVVRAETWEQLTVQMAQLNAFVRKAKIFGQETQTGVQPPSQPTVPPTPQEDPAPAQGEASQCPRCSKEMWDNRPKKADGTFKETSPDFKCKDQACGGVIWPVKQYNDHR